MAGFPRGVCTELAHGAQMGELCFPRVVAARCARRGGLMVPGSSWSPETSILRVWGDWTPSRAVPPRWCAHGAQLGDLCLPRVVPSRCARRAAAPNGSFPTGGDLQPGFGRARGSVAGRNPKSARHPAPRRALPRGARPGVLRWCMAGAGPSSSSTPALNCPR
jgi:hypothetical protein